MDFFAPIEKLTGVGPRRAEAFLRLGVERIIDLIFHLPRRYDDRRLVTPIADLRPRAPALVAGRLIEIRSKRIRPNLSMHRALLRDETDEIAVTFFNQDYILERSRAGDRWMVFGQKVRFREEWSFSLREIDLTGKGTVLGQGMVLPFYPATTATPQRYIRRLLRDLVLRLGREPLDAPRYEAMPDFAEAARLVHLPRSPEEAERGRRRLALDELVGIRLCVEQARRKRPAIERPARGAEIALALPFTLTPAQETIRAEIERDLDGPRPMRRLIEGDVGSGKTVLAVLAAVHAAERGQATVFLAPTEILAEQHHRTWGERLARAGLPAYLLTGATPAREREIIDRAAATRRPLVVFGTHALLSSHLVFPRLGLVVIDEQQRFGVGQREAILRKGTEQGITPDLLILTATPIPRTLAMTLYGDLEISTLRERLPGREAVPTVHLRESERKRLMPYLRRALERDERVYIVYPIIEEADEGLGLKNAKGQYKKIKQAFPEAGVALLTGETGAGKKEEIMRDFRDGRISILVATSVVEVGIDVPEATLMIVEHAEHFGLSQLHQLRGRVGRSDRGGTCILTTADEMGEYGERRLAVLVACQDGFEIAEQDLRLRGPGEVLGERQHGSGELRVARLGLDADLVPRATNFARGVLDQDPSLARHVFLRHFIAGLEHGGADVL